MNQDELVNAIISEVKRVLAQRGITVGASDGGKQISALPPSPVQTAGGPTAAVVPSSAIGITDMSGKQVITQKDLEPYKGQAITVGAKAVITPLAVDYAREKKITISRTAPASGQKADHAQAPADGVSVALTVSPDFKGDGSMLKTLLAAKHLGVKDATGGTYEAGVKKVAEAVASGSVNFGICLENTGMEAPIFANRNSRIRAVHCRDTMEARAARIDIGANVIVLDSTSNPEAIISGFTGL
ncbi:RpiB/LacA/LacB family sugar-phosphate isomerase [bacterium]|nr:RpiB/LacA/LacB family sugar-phosphate isomerase [bacterium]